MQDQIIEAGLNWARAIAARSPEKVTELYHPDGLLWGTLAKEVRHGHEKIKAYFVQFLQREDLMCQFKDGVIRMYDDYAFYSGAYEFTWRVADKTIIVPARFSFIFKNENGHWLILEHHSSLYPDNQFKLKNLIIQS